MKVSPEMYFLIGLDYRLQLAVTHELESLFNGSASLPYPNHIFLNRAGQFVRKHWKLQDNWPRHLGGDALHTERQTGRCTLHELQ